MAHGGGGGGGGGGGVGEERREPQAEVREALARARTAKGKGVKEVIAGAVLPFAEKMRQAKARRAEALAGMTPDEREAQYRAKEEAKAKKKAKLAEKARAFQSYMEDRGKKKAIGAMKEAVAVRKQAKEVIRGAVGKVAQKRVAEREALVAEQLAIRAKQEGRPPPTAEQVRAMLSKAPSGEAGGEDESDPRSAKGTTVGVPTVAGEPARTGFVVPMGQLVIVPLGSGGKSEVRLNGEKLTPANWKTTYRVLEEVKKTFPSKETTLIRKMLGQRINDHSTPAQRAEYKKELEIYTQYGGGGASGRGGGEGGVVSGGRR